MGLSINIEDLTDAQILDIMNTCKGEFWHKDGYYVTERCYYFENYKYHHSEFFCERGDEKWFGCPHDIIGNIIHIDGIFDEMCERGLGLEGG